MSPKKQSHSHEGEVRSTTCASGPIRATGILCKRGDCCCLRSSEQGRCKHCHSSGRSETYGHVSPGSRRCGQVIGGDQFAVKRWLSGCTWCRGDIGPSPACSRGLRRVLRSSWRWRWRLALLAGEAHYWLREICACRAEEGDVEGVAYRDLVMVFSDGGQDRGARGQTLRLRARLHG